MTESRPLVSIVTPCYNSARYLERCIESVLAQDYSPVEHVIQDGGSTDGTVDILRKYGDRVKWISERDNGQSDGLNRALQRCKGDIIGVLNADDEYLPGAARWAVEAMARHPDAAAVYGDQYDIDEEGRVIAEYRPPPYDFAKMLCCELVIPAQAAFIRRASFEQVGLRADTDVPTCPDYEMWLRIGRRFTMAYAPGFVARYRCHSGSEGHQNDMMPRMLRTKLGVADRLLLDPAAPPAIRALRRRAHSGILWWGACVLARQAAPARASACMVRSLLLYPAPRQTSRLRVFFRAMADHNRRGWRLLSQVALAVNGLLERVLWKFGLLGKED